MQGYPKASHLTNEQEHDFRIRFDVIVRNDIWTTDNWKEHPVVRKMVSLLPSKRIEDLFDEVIANEPMVESGMIELEEWKKLANDQDLNIRDEFRKKIRDSLLSNNYTHVGHNQFNLYYIAPYQYFGVNLNQPVEIKRDHEAFPLLFSFRLSKTKYPVEFLEFHLSETFAHNIGEYKILLAQLVLEIISNRIQLVTEWKEQKLNTNATSTEKKCITALEHALLLYIKIESKEITQQGAKKKFLSDYAGKIGIGQGKFPTHFYEVERLFRESNSKLIELIKGVLPHLTGESRNFAQLSLLKLASR